MFSVSYRMAPPPPFRLDLTVWALRRSPANAIDLWDGRTYRRALAWRDGVVRIAVSQNGAVDSPVLAISFSGRGGQPPPGFVEESLTRLLGTNIDLAGFYGLAEQDPHLGPLVERFRGMKPPRFPSVFEAVVNGIACQQLSLASGISVLSSLTIACGSAVDGVTEGLHAFPRSEDLAQCAPEQLRELGFSRQKASYIVELASKATGGLDLEQLERLSDDEAVKALTALRGVGRWTAEYVLLRGLGRLHVFPGDDVGMRNRLREWLDLSGPLDYNGAREVLAPWVPYAGLVYLHLLLRGLEAKGHIR